VSVFGAGSIVRKPVRQRLIVKALSEATILARGKVGFVERSSCQSKRQFLWNRGNHTEMAFCAGRGDTPRGGDPILVDESLEQIVPETIQPGDIVGISVHTGNALRGYAVGRMARSRGAW